jgi:hypothetical protein
VHAQPAGLRWPLQMPSVCGTRVYGSHLPPLLLCPQNLEALSLLEDLWLNDNQIEDLGQVEQALQHVKDSLAVIYLENNPVAKDAQYKEHMRALLPKLEQLDATPL